MAALGLHFRVARNTFDEELAAALDLPDVDDLDDVPVFGRQPRVRVKNANPPWQEVVISLLKPEDIESPAFEQFLKEGRRVLLRRGASQEARSE